MILECEYCEALVDAVLIGAYETNEPAEYFEEQIILPLKVTFLKCPKCNSPFLAAQNDFGDGWDEPSRIFPAKEKFLGLSIPIPIREAYMEAIACFRSKANTAACIMCRKVLEGICREHEIEARKLGEALSEMRTKGIIENRLFEWAEALRVSGNEAAHDVKKVFSKQDAKDILDFTEAILEYVFTIQNKFNEFRKRREEGNKKDKK